MWITCGAGLGLLAHDFMVVVVGLFCVCIADIVVSVVWVDCCVGGGARAVCVGLLLMVLMFAVLRF